MSTEAAIRTRSLVPRSSPLVSRGAVHRHYSSCNSQRFRKRTPPALEERERHVLAALASLIKYPHPLQPQLHLQGPKNKRLAPETSQQVREIAAVYRAGQTARSRYCLTQLLVRRSSPRNLPESLLTWERLLTSGLAADGSNAAVISDCARKLKQSALSDDASLSSHRAVSCRRTQTASAYRSPRNEASESLVATPLLNNGNFRRAGRSAATSFTRRPIFRRRTERSARQVLTPSTDDPPPAWFTTRSAIDEFYVKALHPVARVVLKNSSYQPAELLCDIPSHLKVDLKEVQRLGGPVSKGAFGTVHRALYRGKEVAVKLCHVSEPATVEQLRNFERELNAYHALKHEHILRFIGASVESLESLALVFDYLPNGNAFELFFENVIKINAAQRLKIAVQLTEVVSYLHQCRPIVIHRDIKTPNLVLDKNYNVKLCDFGKTKFMHRAFLMLEDNGGSPRYMAPECFVPNGIITEKADIWSLACCLIEIFGGPIPHEDHFDNEAVIHVTLFERRSPMVPPWFHPLVREVLSRCFEWTGNRRPTAQEIHECIASLVPKDLEDHGMDTKRPLR